MLVGPATVMQEGRQKREWRQGGCFMGEARPHPGQEQRAVKDQWAYWCQGQQMAEYSQEPTTNSFIPTTCTKSGPLGPPTSPLGPQLPTPPFSVSDYHKSLEDALSSDTSGHFRRILISLATVGDSWPQACWPSGALGGGRGCYLGGRGQEPNPAEEWGSSLLANSVPLLSQLLPRVKPSPLFTFQSWFGATFSGQPSRDGPQPGFLGTRLTRGSHAGDLSLCCYPGAATTIS